MRDAFEKLLHNGLVSTPDAPGTLTDVTTGKPRRLASALLSLLTPGLGHAAIGFWRRAVPWLVAGVVPVILLYLAVIASAPRLMWFAIGMVFLVRIAALVDTVRLPRSTRLPRPRIILALVVALVVVEQGAGGWLRTNVVEAFRIPVNSMYPTLESGDHLLVAKIPATFARGDVAIFRYPLDQTVRYVKRIVAVGGDTVAIRDGRLVVNGRMLERSATQDPCPGEEDDRTCAIWRERLDSRFYRIAIAGEAVHEDFSTQQIPQDHVFLLGDARGTSQDSRTFGPVPNRLLEGKARFVWWSSGALGIRLSRLNQLVE